MNTLSTFDQSDHTGRYGAAPGRPYGIVIAIAISLLLHALLVIGFRGQHRPTAPEPSQATQPLTVWLAPAPLPEPLPAPPPPVAVAQTPRPPPPKMTANRDQRASDNASNKAPPKTIIALPAPADNGSAVHVAPNSSDSADPFAEKTPAPAPATPAFDIDAARRVARQVASERDPAKVGTAVGQIPDKPLKDQSDLARNIDSGKRANCKDGIPGGLLAPLFLLMDKKDSGCKW